MRFGATPRERVPLLHPKVFELFTKISDQRDRPTRAER